jgi:4-hydroxybenzoate polyprenyltransferase
LVILIQLDRLAIMLGIASLLLVGLYPLMKRVTWWPQLFLGFTFNWGALLGYAAATGRLTAPALLLYAAGIAWTLAYDTIYAHQDKDDDALVGIKSTARRLGASSRLFVGLFAAVAVLLFALAFMCAGLAWPAFLALAAAAAQFAWQTARVRFDDPADCLAKFRSNRWIGWLLLAGIGLGRWLAPA